MSDLQKKLKICEKNITDYEKNKSSLQTSILDKDFYTSKNDKEIQEVNNQLKIIKNYIKGYIAEVGQGNGMNANSYIKYPKKIDLYEPTKKLYQELKKTFKKRKRRGYSVTEKCRMKKCVGKRVKGKGWNVNLAD